MDEVNMKVFGYNSRHVFYYEDRLKNEVIEIYSAIIDGLEKHLSELVIAQTNQKETK